MKSKENLIAVLGPTNTGKTYYAIERMLSHNSGVIGLPLRLLAREVFDRIVSLRGRAKEVALITGEERIIPVTAKYWICTVEAMPKRLSTEFLAIDEIQLCVDSERGHVFTDRLLHYRGTKETLFLGSNTIRSCIEQLFPRIKFVVRDRFSKLSYTGSKRIDRIPSRSAIVAFSVQEVYAIAELIRREKGGAAVVTGALSPRTRNSQVEIYQNGDVDYLIATDAIGMGLNLDISHVALAGLSKFDGDSHRKLLPNELAQIFGRAGRYLSDGTFGVTANASNLDPHIINSIENSQFPQIKKLQWRNADLSFASLDSLILSLQSPAAHSSLQRTRETTDVSVLKDLSNRQEVMEQLKNPQDIKLLWDVCQIPDYRKIATSVHSNLLFEVFSLLMRNSRIPDDWFSKQVQEINKFDGDIDILSKRLAFIRTWTYLANRKNWVSDPYYWRGQAQAIENKLSDALHQCLISRFVDRRTSILMQRLRKKETFVTELNENGELFLEGQFIGRIIGFQLELDKSASGTEAKTLLAASTKVLKSRFELLVEKLYLSSDEEFLINETGAFLWKEQLVGHLKKGHDTLYPSIEVLCDEIMGKELKKRVETRLDHFFDRFLHKHFESLYGLIGDKSIEGLSRGLCFRLVEGMGVLPRDLVRDEVKSLDQEARKKLRKYGVRFGQYTIFLAPMLKPAATRLRLLLWTISEEIKAELPIPPPGLVTIVNTSELSSEYYTKSGFKLLGLRAIRVDILERLADLIREQNKFKGFEATLEMLSLSGLSYKQFADVMKALGFIVEIGSRGKVNRLDVNQPNEKQQELTLETSVEIAKHNIKSLGSKKNIVEKEVVEVVKNIDPANKMSTEEFEDFYLFKVTKYNINKRDVEKSSGMTNAIGTLKTPKNKIKKINRQVVDKSIKQKKQNEKIDMDNPFAALLKLKSK